MTLTFAHQNLFILEYKWTFNSFKAFLRYAVHKNGTDVPENIMPPATAITSAEAKVEESYDLREM